MSMLVGGQAARPQLRMIAENAQCLVNWGFLWFCVRVDGSVCAWEQGMLKCRLLGAASRGC